MPLPLPQLSLQIAAVACLVAALDGGYGLISPRSAGRLQGLELAADASNAALRALAGSRLIAHAGALAVIWTAPAVGACLAAGVGCGWLGAAAGRAVSIPYDLGHARAHLLRALGAALMGLALWLPLWSYLRALEHAAAPGFGA